MSERASRKVSSAWGPLLWTNRALRTGSRQVDAYRQWDKLTGDARHGSAFTHFPVLLELAQTATVDSLREAIQGEQWRSLVDLLDMSLSLAPNSLIHTAIVPRGAVAALEVALRKDIVKRYTLGAGCEVREPNLKHVQIVEETGPNEEPYETLGIIDDGCCFAHEDFRGHGPGSQPRLLSIWDQGLAPEPAQDPQLIGVWTRQRLTADGNAVSYGAELTREGIKKVLQAYPDLGEAVERSCYQAIGRPDWGPPWHTHGARVMHLLAKRSPTANSGHAPKGADKPIIFVQLPKQTIEDTSGDSLGVHVVDGARYIVQRTKSACAKGRRWRTTICISLGSIAGPHDGSSMAEKALRELATEGSDDGDVTIAVAAGNSGAGSRIHAQGSVGGQASASATFLVRAPAQSRRDSFVEVWLPAEALVEGTSVQVESPSGESTAVQLGEYSALSTAGGSPSAALVFPKRCAQGENGALALLCLGPTALTEEGRTPAAAGIWSLTVTSPGAPLCEVHAWIERDDIIIGERRRQQTRFEPTSARDETVNDDYTLSSLANTKAELGVHFYVAGGIVGAAKGPYQLAPYTSAGPLVSSAGEQPRTAYAVVERSCSVPGISVPGFYSGSRSRLNGTSAAAPQIAANLAGQKFVRELPPAGGPETIIINVPKGSPLPDVNSDGSALRRSRSDRRTAKPAAAIVVGSELAGS